MVITRAYKIRLYPNKAQKSFFNKTFGCCRVIYNKMLYKLQDAYKNDIKLSKNQVFKDIKSELEWIKQADSQGLCQTFMDERRLDLKSSDSMNQELLYKDHSILEGSLL